MKKIYILGFLGLISGCISAFFTVSSVDSQWLMLFFFPGAVFGCIGLIYSLICKQVWWRHLTSLIFVLASTGSYYAAVYVSIRIMGESVGDKSTGPLMSLMSMLFVSIAVPMGAISPMSFPFLIGGLVGGLLLSISWFLFVCPLPIVSIPILTILSGALGMIAASAPGDESNIFYVLYILWQFGMASAIGVAMYYRTPSEKVSESAPVSPEA